MTITPMTPETVAPVAELEHASFSTPWSETSIREELSNEWALWLVAFAGDSFLGYIGIQYGPDGGDIMSIATAPASRGKGVAKALIRSARDFLREKGLGYLTLEVRPSNLSALGLYQAMGFTEVGRRKKYYRNPTEDAILLTLFFEEEPKTC